MRLVGVGIAQQGDQLALDTERADDGRGVERPPQDVVVARAPRARLDRVLPRAWIAVCLSPRVPSRSIESAARSACSPPRSTSPEKASRRTSGSSSCNAARRVGASLELRVPPRVRMATVRLARSLDRSTVPPGQGSHSCQSGGSRDAAGPVLGLLARDVAQYEDAFHLLHIAFVYQGIEDVRSNKMPFTPQHVLPEPTLFTHIWTCLERRARKRRYLNRCRGRRAPRPMRPGRRPSSTRRGPPRPRPWAGSRPGGVHRFPQ